MVEERLGNFIAEVKSLKNNKVNFKLREKEVKHIRRCLRKYDTFYHKDYENKENKEDLSKIVYDKFYQFGRLANRIKGKRKNTIIEQLLQNRERKCFVKDCPEKENLTLAHIVPLSSSKENFINQSDNFELLCPKHHLLNDLKDILFRKNLEIEKLKKRIEDIEKRDTTDLLGFQGLDKDRFINIDEN